jgi:hypothetical protein
VFREAWRPQEIDPVSGGRFRRDREKTWPIFALRLAAV